MFKRTSYITALLYLSLIRPAFADDHILKPIYLLTDAGVPVALANDITSEFGAMLNKAKAIIEKTGLAYEVRSLPWPRAIRELEERNNAVIIGLIRTKEREDDYIWLHSINKIDYQLFSKNLPRYKNLSKEMIISGKYYSVCQTGSAQCSMLTNYGFPDEKILHATETKEASFDKLLLHGRVDFIVSQADEIHEDLIELGQPIDSFKAVAHLKSVTAYMAASKKTFDKRYIKLIQNKAE